MAASTDFLRLPRQITTPINGGGQKPQLIDAIVCYTRNDVLSAVQAFESIGSLTVEAAAAVIGQRLETGNCFLVETIVSNLSETP